MRTGQVIATRRRPTERPASRRRGRVQCGRSHQPVRPQRRRPPVVRHACGMQREVHDELQCRCPGEPTGESPDLRGSEDGHLDLGFAAKRSLLPSHRGLEHRAHRPRNGRPRTADRPVTTARTDPRWQETDRFGSRPCRHVGANESPSTGSPACTVDLAWNLARHFATVTPCQALVVSEGPGTIVVIEDDPNIADLVDMYLRRDGFRVIQATSGEAGPGCDHTRAPAARRRGHRPPRPDGRPRGLPDAAVLERRPNRHPHRPRQRDRPGARPRARCRRLRHQAVLPRELVARIKAILRRSDQSTRAGPAGPLRVGDVEVDTDRHEVRLGGQVVALTAREFDLLAYLAENEGLVLSRRQLLDGVWGADWVGDDRTVDVHVRQLRKKLGELASALHRVGRRLPAGLRIPERAMAAR